MKRFLFLLAALALVASPGFASIEKKSDELPDPVTGALTADATVQTTVDTLPESVRAADLPWHPATETLPNDTSLLNDASDITEPSAQTPEVDHAS